MTAKYIPILLSLLLFSISLIAQEFSQEITKKDFEVDFRDVTGEVVMRNKVRNSSERYNIQNLAEGVYTATIYYKGEVLFTKRIVRETK